MSGRKTTGKPPSLEVMLKSSKQDLQSRAYHVSINLFPPISNVPMYTIVYMHFTMCSIILSIRVLF